MVRVDMSDHPKVMVFEPQGALRSLRDCSERATPKPAVILTATQLIAIKRFTVPSRPQLQQAESNGQIKDSARRASREIPLAGHLLFNEPLRYAHYLTRSSNALVADWYSTRAVATALAIPSMLPPLLIDSISMQTA